MKGKLGIFDEHHEIHQEEHWGQQRKNSCSNHISTSTARDLQYSRHKEEEDTEAIGGQLHQRHLVTEDVGDDGGGRDEAAAHRGPDDEVDACIASISDARNTQDQNQDQSQDLQQGDTRDWIVMSYCHIYPFGDFNDPLISLEICPIQRYHDGARTYFKFLKFCW